MARRTTAMNINLEGNKEKISLEMQEPDQMPVISVARWDTFSEIVNMMVISPLIINRPRMAKHLWTSMIQ